MSSASGQAKQDSRGTRRRLRDALGDVGVAKVTIAAFLTAFALDAMGTNPLADIHISTFDRQIGEVAVADWSTGALISHFLVLYLVMVPVLFAVFLAVVAVATRDDGSGGEASRSRDIVSLSAYISGYGLVAFSLRCALMMVAPGDGASGLGATGGVMLGSMTVCATSVVFALLWCAGAKAWPSVAKGIGGESAEWALAIGLVTVLPLHLLVSAAVPELRLCFVFLFLPPVAIGVSWLVSRKSGGGKLPLMRSASIPLFFSTLAMSVCIEAVNVANQRSFPVPEVHWTVFLALCVLFLVAVVLSFALRKRTLPDWRAWFAPLALASFAIVAGQPELQSFYAADFFESANMSVSVSEFLVFGEIPIIENHGAHMLSDYIWNILFGMINGNPVDASFRGYTCIGSALTVLLFYYIVRELVGPRPAFFAALLLPVNSLPLIHLSFLAFAGLIFALKRGGFAAYLLFWSSLVVGVLYKGDYGLAAGIGAAVALVLCLLYKKKWREVACSLAALAITAFVWLLLFFLLCSVRGIEPVARLQEFVCVMGSSNQNWAVATIGSNETAIFPIVYVFTPIAVVALTVASIVRGQRDGKYPMAGIVIGLIVCCAVAYYSNFPRALVRHSLSGNNCQLDTTFAAWVIAISFLILTRNIRSNHVRAAFPCVLLLFPVALAAISGNVPWGVQSSFEGALARCGNGAIAVQQVLDGDIQYQRFEGGGTRVERVVFSPQMQLEYVGVLAELDEILGPDDTWVDFTNQTSLYALASRNNPVYVNQSPGLLAGDASQDYFVQELETAKPLVALLPRNENLFLGSALDGVQNSYRYYRVSEYLYTHYTPYETVGDFAIWLRDGAAPASEGYTPIEIPNELIADADFSGATCLLGSDGSVEVASTDGDPQISDLSNILQNAEIDGDSLAIEFECVSEKGGTFQLYWAEGGASYSEDRAQSVSVDPGVSKTVRFCVPKSSTMRYRLDFPEGKTEIMNGFTLSRSGAHRCDYGYASMLHSYDLGAVPFLWANYDEKDAWSSQELAALSLDEQMQGELERPEDMSSAYIALDLRAESNEVVTFELLRLDGKDDSSAKADSLATFTFDAREGDNRYLIRPSADFYWHTGMVDACRVSGAVEVLDARILLGD